MRIESSVAAPLLRISLSVLLLWFGVWQVAAPESWTAYVPGWVDAFADATLLTVSNGIFEIALGLVLASGFFVRAASLLGFLHVFFIALNLGYSDIMVRDLALAAAFLAVFFNGPDRLCKT